VEDVRDASLTEQAGEKLSFDGKVATVVVNPWEIRTLRVRLQTPAPPQ
jgi:hypothetical protein